MLTKDNTKRITIKELLQHPWIVHDSPDLGKQRCEANKQKEFQLFSLVNPFSMKIYDEVSKRATELSPKK